MPTYNITYACGHTCKELISGPQKTREWILKNKESELCPDCYKKHLIEQREIERTAAKEAAKEQDLPDLVGTEKQVAWAITIRAKYIENLSNALDSRPISDKIDLTLLHEVISSIQNESSASWWIENGRTENSYYILSHVATRYRELLKQREILGGTEIELANESMVRPETPISEIPVKIRISDNIIQIEYADRNDILREIVKGKKFTWNGCFWVREIRRLAGTLQDRVGEIGNHLLHAGFIVQIFDEIAREKAISGNYEPECLRWITRLTEGKYKDYFSLTWERGNESIYTATRKVAGSRWNKPAVVIPSAQYEAVLDIADEFGFKLSPEAINLTEEARQIKEGSLIIKPGEGPSKTSPDIKKQTPPGEIDDDLRDND